MANFISTSKYLETAKKHLINYTNYIMMVTGKWEKGHDLEVVQVWYCKTIQNHKGLFIVLDKTEDKLMDRFTEVTYNGDKSQMYFDVYEKQAKFTVELEESEKT